MPGSHGLADQGAQFGVGIEIREALAQVDGLVLDGEPAHDSENRGADIGQLGSDHGNGRNVDKQWECVSRKYPTNSSRSSAPAGARVRACRWTGGRGLYAVAMAASVTCETSEKSHIG